MPSTIEIVIDGLGGPEAVDALLRAPAGTAAQWIVTGEISLHERALLLGLWRDMFDRDDWSGVLDDAELDAQ